MAEQGPGALRGSVRRALLKPLLCAVCCVLPQGCALLGQRLQHQQHHLPAATGERKRRAHAWGSRVSLSTGLRPGRSKPQAKTQPALDVLVSTPPERTETWLGLTPHLPHVLPPMCPLQEHILLSVCGRQAITWDCFKSCQTHITDFIADGA